MQAVAETVAGGRSGGGGGGAGGAGTGVQVRSMERALPSATRDGVTLDEETANLERRLRRLMRT